MRMNDPDGRLNGNVLSMRISRMMTDYTIIFTWRGTCDWASPTKDQERRLAKLDQEALDNNSTRRFTPGLMYPELGEAGGRIPVPDPGRKRSLQSYRQKPPTRRAPRPPRVSRSVPSRGSRAPKKRQASAKATAPIPAYLVKPIRDVRKRQFKGRKSARKQVEDVGLGREIRKATEASRATRERDGEVDVEEDEEDMVSGQDENTILEQDEDMSFGQDDQVDHGQEEYSILGQQDDDDLSLEQDNEVGHRRYVVGPDGHIDLSQGEYLPFGEDGYLPLGEPDEYLPREQDEKMESSQQDPDDSSYNEDGVTDYETDATEESPIRPQVTAASRTAYLARLGFVPRSQSGMNDAFTIGVNAANMLELSDEDAPYEEATELDWALDTYWYRP